MLQRVSFVSLYNCMLYMPIEPAEERPAGKKNTCSVLWEKKKIFRAPFRSAGAYVYKYIHNIMTLRW